MLLDIARKLQGKVGVVENSSPDLLGIFLDDGERLVHLVETLISESISFADIGRDIFIGLGEVGKDRFRKAVVTLVRQIQGLGGVFVALDSCDGVRNDRV